jgi:hypothetical protein
MNEKDKKDKKNKKNYALWMPIKADINNDARRPDFKERDIFWTSIGENVGFEEDGKGRWYDRPVLTSGNLTQGCFGASHSRQRRIEEDIITR